MHRALHRHVAQNKSGQPFRSESIDWVHSDAVTVGVDQLFVDPVAAALRELVDVQLARGQHNLASGAVDCIAINVDVRKIVVGADFLDLTKRVLQRAPVPQPDVLQRSLIVRRVGGLDGRLCGKFALQDPVQPVRLPSKFDVVGDVGLLAN